VTEYRLVAEPRADLDIAAALVILAVLHVSLIQQSGNDGEGSR